MAAVPDFTALATLKDSDRTTFKRDNVKPSLAALSPAWNPTKIASLFRRLLPYLKLDERAEVIASVLAKGEYHPFRDGRHPSDIVRPGFVLDAKSVGYRFSYKSHPFAAVQQFMAYRETGFLPGLVIVYPGKEQDHCVIFLPGLLRARVSVTLKRVVDHPKLWTWKKDKPVGILISRDGDDLTRFFRNPTHVSDAMTRMEIAMATAARVRKKNPQIDKDWNSISQETLVAAFKTDIGQEMIAAAEALAEARGEARGEAKGRLAEKRQIFLTLCQTMSEAEARRVTGYTGS